MADFLFPHFLSDAQEYGQSEARRRESWDELLRLVAQETQWETPWINTNFVNGTPIQDGNPIFSAISYQRKLGVRVIQLEPAGDLREFVYWIDTFAEGSPEAVHELVISCVLTAESLNEVVELVRHWITEEKHLQSRES